MESSPYNLDGLDEDLREALERAICAMVLEAVAGATERNAQLQIWRDQLENLSVTSANKNWTNACNICDPISMEAFLTILAQIMGALHRDPKVAVEPFFQEDEEGARILESWLSMESSRSSIDRHLYNFAHDCCWSQATIGYVGWEQTTRTQRDIGYRSQSGRLLTGPETEEDEAYTQVPVAEVVAEERYCIRTVDLSDFFLYPSTSPCIDRATLVCERMSVTEAELRDGIDDFGYSETAVEELCTLGPSPPTEEAYIKASQEGLDTDQEGLGGFYEIFSVYTRLPKRLPGTEQTTPARLLQDDFLVVCVPERNIVLKMAFSPFAERPYFAGGILPKKDSILGYSLMAMLEGLQAEANANIQLTIDAMNLTMCPVLTGPKSEAENIQKTKVQPGAFLGLDIPNSVVPLEWDRAPFRDGINWQMDIRNRSKAIVSAEGQGQLQSKVRKQGEIDNLLQQVSAKFGLYLSNFQRTVVAELFRRLVLLKTQFGAVGDEGEEFLDSEGHSQKLTPQALRGKYNIVASGTSLTHSPEARVEVGKQKQAIQTEYLLARSKLPPDLSKLAWHGARELLLDLGERNPEAWLGDEPEEQQQLPPQMQQQPPYGNGTGQPPQQLFNQLQNGTGVNN